MAFTLGAMGSPTKNFYKDAYRQRGFEDEALEVQKLLIDGDREKAAQQVPA